MDVLGVLRDRISDSNAPLCFRFVKVEDLNSDGSWSIHAITAVPCDGDSCPSVPEAFNCLCEIGVCEAAASTTPLNCEDIEISYSSVGVQVRNGVGGSNWTIVSSTHGSGGSYLATSSKAADRHIEVQSSLGSGYYSLYVFLPIPLSRSDLSNSVPYSFGSHTMWMNQREKSSGGHLRLEVAGVGADAQTVFFLDPPTIRLDTINSSSGLVIADAFRFCRTNGPTDAEGSASSFVSNPLAASGFVVAGVLATIGVLALVRMAMKRRNKSPPNAASGALPPAASTLSTVQLTEVHAASESARNLQHVEHLYAKMGRGELANSASSST